MSAQAGWYPDPGGRPGRFRYWDGRQWSEALSADPYAPPPGQVPYGQVPYGQVPYGQVPYGQVPAAEKGSRRTAAAWWLATGAVVVALVLLVGWVIRLGTGGAGSGVQAQPTTQVCPPGEVGSPTPMPPQPADGRVHGGKLSFPMLGEPFGPVIPETQVPFARNTVQQLVVVEPAFDGLSDWVAPVMVGDLVAGDGFFTPRDGARVVVDCVVDRFYGDSRVDRLDVRNESTTIDGHDAWLVESQLSFDVPGLQTDGELLLVAIVSTGPTSAGIFYASIPDTTPELVQPARQALAGLQVDD